MCPPEDTGESRDIPEDHRTAAQEPKLGFHEKGELNREVLLN